ncbi:MAG: DMT family transporter [Candidatus Thorarchaeota archaeon]|nr:DMT family transporter [Candidatus Thorarchaeota archaeon]
MQLTPEVLLGTAVGLTASALWAVSVVIYRSQSEGIRPIGISSIKMWVAFGFMSLIVFLPFRPNPLAVSVESIFFLAVSVTLGAVVGDTLYLISQERIGVSYAFPIAMSSPILTYFLAIQFVEEPFIISRLVGTVITVAGIVLISRERNASAEKQGNPNMDLIGIALALLTMVLWASGTVILQIGATGVDPIDANFVRVVFGAIEFIPIFVIAQHQGMPMPTRRATKVIAISALFGMAIGSILFVWMVQLLNAALASVVGSTSSLFAVPISIFFLKEKVTRKAGVGVLLTVAGVMLAVVAF